MKPSKLEKEIEKIITKIYDPFEMERVSSELSHKMRIGTNQLLQLCSSVCDDVIYKLTDLLEHGDFCDHCRENALDIADYFNKRGRFKETKTKKEKVV